VINALIWERLWRKESIEEGIVTCKSHKAKIDVRTGEIVEKAQLLFLKMPTKKAAIYGVEEKNGDLYIELS
jgi:nitrite reductase/ring-hydroxylating ferredoxin subunit